MSLRDMGLFSLGSRRLSRCLNSFYAHFKGGCQDDAISFFSMVPSDKGQQA